MANHSLIIFNGKIQKQFLSFKLHAVLSSMMKYHVILLHPTRDVKRPFVQLLRNVYAFRICLVAS